jgi:hypothetical protein
MFCPVRCYLKKQSSENLQPAFSFLNFLCATTLVSQGQQHVHAVPSYVILSIMAGHDGVFPGPFRLSNGESNAAIIVKLRLQLLVHYILRSAVCRSHAQS